MAFDDEAMAELKAYKAASQVLFLRRSLIQKRRERREIVTAKAKATVAIEDYKQKRVHRHASDLKKMQCDIGIQEAEDKLIYYAELAAQNDTEVAFLEMYIDQLDQMIQATPEGRHG